MPNSPIGQVAEVTAKGLQCLGLYQNASCVECCYNACYGTSFRDEAFGYTSLHLHMPTSCLVLLTQTVFLLECMQELQSYRDMHSWHLFWRLL